ncbi:metallophosphoesterase family protein [Enterococcus hirae]|uniref:metallophosphoesterase n=1 Tax=Enterococcus TaxID=1350 RepID=UPI0009BD8C47|nr:metallophosphoesterase [Enterococcus hirae]EMF0062261.1 metallophosphoesterase family protein [Enterococcus hirae]EMF0088285.1 metallophosphoesterase family protein [Enterococcus hirae]EMF0179770.1 metallophosphoesterase family protein [Enterococcus hirae]EMF0523744.1 metallophosphoesterase family protein [Enterococcus hirae]MBA5269506.1 metallophosphoesterase family protein [Enterococcus hirae]
MNFFISDMHFFHKNLLGKNDFAPRLFASVEEMNQQLINSWNKVVKETDHVYHLGDLAMHPQYEKGSQDILELVQQLNGTIHLIKGNHDSRAFFRYLEKHHPGNKVGSKKFYFYDVGTIIKFNHQQYYLTHYPMLLGSNDSIRNLHGHIHHYSVPIGNDVNVGVDAPERELLKVQQPFGTPLSEDDIEEIYEAKQQELARLQQK